MREKFYILFLFVVSILISCSPHSICEALYVTAQADSLRKEGKTYGIEEGDSTLLAQSYHVLNKWDMLYTDEYIHACYHYGRLLREKGNQTGAMHCFINALHSNTQDKNLRGRIFTNIAVMCRLEGNHKLAYEMFDLSREEFKANNDTIAYYYALNNMAFELAEQAQVDKCLSLLNLIEENCKNIDVKIKTLETKAEAYFVAQKYDSAIYYAEQLQQKGNYEPTGLLIKAQSYSYLGVKDSAVHYASIVINQTTSLFDQNNSLYILANDKPNAHLDEIQQAHAARSDVQKQIEERRSALSRAIEILEQEINKKPNYIEVVLFAVAILVIALISIYSYSKIYKKQKQVENHTRQEQEKQLRLQLEQDRLKAQTEQLRTANNELQHQQATLIQQQTDYQQQQLKKVEQLCEALRESHNIKKELHWSDYDQMCEIINTHFNFFANKLKASNVLTNTEIKLCILVLIDLRFSQIAEILPYAQNSIGKLKDTAAKHLGTTGKMLRKSLLAIVIDKH